MCIQYRLSFALTLLLLPVANLYAADESAASEGAEVAETAEAAEEEGGFWAQFKDPEDGKFDMSAYLLEKFAGFMPV
ncbi:MAG: hypothetical protein ACR2QL_02255, partial [Woeseiaceae bacterium]